MSAPGHRGGEPSIYVVAAFHGGGEDGTGALSAGSWGVGEVLQHLSIGAILSFQCINTRCSSSNNHLFLATSQAKLQRLLSMRWPLFRFKAFFLLFLLTSMQPSSLVCGPLCLCPFVLLLAVVVWVDVG